MSGNLSILVLERSKYLRFVKFPRESGTSVMLLKCDKDNTINRFIAGSKSNSNLFDSIVKLLLLHGGMVKCL